MYRNHCGKANPDDAWVCAYCGAALIGGGVAERRLMRPRGGRRIAGVCAGLAQYYRWNVTTIRLLWLLLFLLGGTGGLLYLSCGLSCRVKGKRVVSGQWLAVSVAERRRRK